MLGGKTKKRIKKLMSLMPKRVRRVNGNYLEYIYTEEIKVGDILRIIPGEMVPADGIVLSGRTAVDQSLMINEELVVDKFVDDEVLSGTINQMGTFDMKVTETGENSAFSKSIQTLGAIKEGIEVDPFGWIAVLVLLAVVGSVLF